MRKAEEILRRYGLHRLAGDGANQALGAIEQAQREAIEEVVAWLRSGTPGASVSPAQARRAADGLEKRLLNLPHREGQ